jgi:lipopolysaccharide export system permease protein
LRTSDVDYFEGLIKPKKFNDNIKGLTIFAEDKNDNDEFINIYIKKRTNKNKFQVTFAKKGIFEDRGESKVLVLYDGESVNNNNNKVTNFSFAKSDFRLGEMESHFMKHRKLQEQSTLDLINCIKSIYLNQKINLLNCNQSKPKNVYKELFKRLVIPFYLPLLILIASINLIITKENINYLKFRYTIFLLGIFTIVVSESALGFVGNLFLKNIFFILLPIISVLILYFILIYKFKFNKIRI